MSDPMMLQPASTTAVTWTTRRPPALAPRTPATPSRAGARATARYLLAHEGSSWAAIHPSSTVRPATVRISVARLAWAVRMAPRKASTPKVRNGPTAAPRVPPSTEAGSAKRSPKDGRTAHGAPLLRAWARQLGSHGRVGTPVGAAAVAPPTDSRRLRSRLGARD